MASAGAGEASRTVPRGLRHRRIWHRPTGLEERTALAEVIGAEAEALVYLYGSCDRAAVYPQLADARVDFLDRFTGQQHVPTAPALRAFVEITAANELDVIRHNPELARQHGDSLAALFALAEQHLSSAARQAWGEISGPPPDCR